MSIFNAPNVSDKKSYLQEGWKCYPVIYDQNQSTGTNTDGRITNLYLENQVKSTNLTTQNSSLNIMPGKSNEMDINAPGLNSTCSNSSPKDDVVKEQNVHKACDIKDDNNLDDKKANENSSTIDNNSQSPHTSDDKKTQEVGYDDDERYEEGYEEEYDGMDGEEQDDQGNYEQHDDQGNYEQHEGYEDFMEEDEEGNAQQYYYEDGSGEYYEEEGEYEEEEENTTKELVKGPNGRLQYVIKGPDGRIKCITDAPPGTRMSEEEEEGENYEHYGGEGDYVEGEEGQYYEENEDGDYIDEKGEYGEDDMVEQYQHFNAENQRQYTEEEKAELMRQYPENYEYMDEGLEYYEDDDEYDEGLIQEEMEQFNQQHSQHAQIQTQQQHQNDGKQEKDLVESEREKNKDDSKNTCTIQSNSSKCSEGVDPNMDANHKSNKVIPATQTANDTKESNQTSEMSRSTGDVVKPNNLTKKQDELHQQQADGSAQKLKHTSQYHHDVQPGSQQMSEEYYSDDEEEFYDDEEEGEDCSGDEEIEAFIQKAIQKKKEQEMRQRAQYGQSQNVNAPVNSIPASQQMINQSEQQLNSQKLPHTESKMTHSSDEICERKNIPATSSPSVQSLSTRNQEGTTNIYSNNKGNFLNNLSSNNLKFKDCEGPIQNMVYLIRSNQRKDFYAMWDGENFVETPMKVSQALPSEALDSKIVGGGAKGRIKGQMLKGNATGLHMSREEEDEPVSTSRPIPRSASMVNLINTQRMSPANTISEGDLLPNGRKWLHTTNTNSLIRQPLHTDEKMCDTSGSKEQYTSGNTPSIKRSYDNVDKYVACKSCGYSSSDLEKCERCSRKFPADVKVHSTKIKNDVSDFTMDRKSFYGQKLDEQLQPYKYAKLSDQRRQKTEEGGQFDSRKSPATYGQRNRSKRAAHLHNVKITISSDEEDSNSNDTGSMGLPVQSPQDTNVNNINTCDSPLFPGIDELKPNHVVSGSIRDRMEDQNGKVKTIRKTKKPMGLPEDLQPMVDGTVSLNVRSVRIGSLKSKPLEPIIMSDKGFSCNVMCERKGSPKCRLMIEADDIVSCQGHLNPPIVVMFLLLNTAGGCKLRERLKMKPNQRAYFDPDSDDKKHKFCVIIFDTLGDSKSVKQIIYQYQIANNGGPNFYTELTHEEANMLLLKTTPLTRAMQAQVGLTIAKEASAPPPLPVQKVFDPTEEEQLEDEYRNFENAEYREDSRSPSPPRVTFTGQLEKLLTYPPPPAKGSLTITNEDLFCLNEGEFLNDVIIDFYLKYLLLEKLSEKDRQRTHVFSSFFYKRLTHKVPKITESSTEVNKQPHVKRHSRVKTWTRHVDLFDKDFIIVPINEHSHWFLAIICYPGLDEPQFCPFLPVPLVKPSNASQSKSQSSSDETSQDGANTPSPSDAGNELSQESGNKTSSKIITGIPLDPEKCIEESDNREYCLGRRQPCILIFDSLAGPSRAAVCRVLKEYLQVEWNIKKGTERNFKDFRGSSPRIPQQNNYSDCGIYVLQYVESFFQSPIMDFTIPMKGLENWFLPEVVERKREDIKNLVLSLQRLYPRSDKKS